MNIQTEEKQKKVIVAGSRYFTDYDFLCLKLDALHLGDVEIVSGHAPGVDSLGERYAIEHGLDLIKFPANWYLYGKSAGPIRNREMAKYADALILFWDGESKGSKNMLKNAQEYDLEIMEILI